MLPLAPQRQWQSLTSWGAVIPMRIRGSFTHFPTGIEIMFQHKSLKEMGDEAQRRLWEKERQADKQAQLEADKEQEIESLKACGVTEQVGYYWAKHVSGIRDPEVVWICRHGTIQIVGDDLSYDKSSFEILKKVDLPT